MFMKKYLSITIISFCIGFMSCEDRFMEFPPSSSFNLDSVFSKYTNAIKLLNDMYSYPIPLNFDTRYFGEDGTRMGGGSFASSLTDEGQPFDVQQGYQVQRYYNGNVEPSTCASWYSEFKGEDDYGQKWITLRKAYILLENIDKVPDNTFPINQGIAASIQKERIKAECKLMIALVYFEMWKRYGGVPIVRESFSTSDPVSSMKQKRATLEETYNFTDSLLNDVIMNHSGSLPAKITVASEFGRFPMALAYAVKARMALYAASPLYNTNSPFSTQLGTNSNLICFMNYDKERWKTAADAATAAIDFCIANGYSLVDDPQQRENGYNYTKANIDYPFRGNTELIWGLIQTRGINWTYYNQIRNLSTYGTYGYATNLVPLNQIERYELKSNVSGKYKSWDTLKTFYINPIAQTASAIEGGRQVAEVARKPYEGLDPRFYASIAYNGLVDYGTEPFIDMADAWIDGNGKPDSIYTNLCGRNGTRMSRVSVLHYVRKFHRGWELREWAMTPINIYMRLAELYLIRAEALNEYFGSSVSVEDDLNIIRARSAMPPVITGQTQDEMRKTIEHERSIEMFYEDQRWFDLRRTLMSEKKIPVDIYKIAIKKWYHSPDESWPYKITYEKQLYSKRVWFDKWYMNPFPTQEIDKNYGLIQNPGW